MKLLINTWRAAWGYDLPFVWMQLHGWGGGTAFANALKCIGGGGPDVYDVNCAYAIRLAQADVDEDESVPHTGMGVAIDACGEDGGGNRADSCNLHPGFKTPPANRLGWQLLRTAFGRTDVPDRPRVLNYSINVAADLSSATATFDISAGAPGALHLQPAHNWQYLFGGAGCVSNSGIVFVNATGGGDPAKLRHAWGLFNATVTISGSTVTAAWDGWDTAAEGGPSSGQSYPTIGRIHAIGYAGSFSSATCTVANSAGFPMGPFYLPVHQDAADLAQNK
jgi:hypothetical protein